MYEDIITVSTVTLKPMWGQKEKNLNGGADIFLDRA